MKGVKVMIGKASTISIHHISAAYNDVEQKINDWLNDHSETEIIDIKFSASATEGEWGIDVLIIYRKETGTC